MLSGPFHRTDIRCLATQPSFYSQNTLRQPEQFLSNAHNRVRLLRARSNIGRVSRYDIW